MEMTYGGALVMPSSYAMMDEEEMMYLNGGGLGKNWYNSVETVAFAIDALIIVMPAIASINQLCKIGKLAQAGRVYLRTNIQVALREAKISVAVSCIGSIVNMLLLVAGMSIGTALAGIVDRVDGKKDGYCFA